MWSNIGAVVLLVVIFAVLTLGMASLYRGMFVRGRTTMNGDDVEDLMFHDDFVRHQNQATGANGPRRWRRGRTGR